MQLTTAWLVEDRVKFPVACWDSLAKWSPGPAPFVKPKENLNGPRNCVRSSHVKLR
jgi:hypothetical protein